MITNVLVCNRLKGFLEPLGYRITSWQWNSPLTATHSELGELEIYFYGENYTVDESALPFSRLQWSRSEFLQIWKTEKTMMSEEAGHVCVGKAILLALTKRASQDNTKRIALAFPDSHNFMKHLYPIVIPLTALGIGFYIITSDLVVAHIPAQSLRKLETGSEAGLLK